MFCRQVNLSVASGSTIWLFSGANFCMLHDFILFQLDRENVEALVALAIMDLRTNEGALFLPLSCSGAPHMYLLIVSYLSSDISFSFSGLILTLYNIFQLLELGKEW